MRAVHHGVARGTAPPALRMCHKPWAEVGSDTKIVNTRFDTPFAGDQRHIDPPVNFVGIRSFSHAPQHPGRHKLVAHHRRCGGGTSGYQRISALPTCIVGTALALARANCVQRMLDHPRWHVPHPMAGPPAGARGTLRARAQLHRKT